MKITQVTKTKIMKTIYLKGLFLLLIAALMSCDDTEQTIFDNENGTSLVSFTDDTSNLEVIKDDEGEVSIEIGVSTVSDQDRTVTVQVDEDRSTANPENYEIVNPQVTIPAGEYVSDLVVRGIDNSVELQRESIVLTFSAAEADLLSESSHSISIFEICPIEPDAFAGEYQLEQLTPINPDDGVLVFENQTVTLSPVEGASTKRSFEAVYLEALGIDQPATEVVFDLVCDEVLVDEALETGLGCGDGTITLGPGNVPASFNLLDDSSFELTLTEYVTDGGCGAAPYQVTFSLTKVTNN